MIHRICFLMTFLSPFGFVLADNTNNCDTENDLISIREVGEPVRHFCSYDDLDEYIEKNQKARKEIAHSLSVDYRALIHEVLPELTKQFTKVYCLDIFGESPDSSLTSSLKLIGHNPTACDPKTAPDASIVKTIQNSDRQILKLYVSSISEASKKGGFIVRAGYNCGLLCGATIDYIIEKDNTDSGYRIQSEKIMRQR